MLFALFDKDGHERSATPGPEAGHSRLTPAFSQIPSMTITVPGRYPSSATIPNDRPLRTYVASRSSTPAPEKTSHWARQQARECTAIPALAKEFKGEPGAGTLPA